MSEEEEARAAPNRSRGESGIYRDRGKFRCARRSRLSYILGLRAKQTMGKQIGGLLNAQDPA